MSLEGQFCDKADSTYLRAPKYNVKQDLTLAELHIRVLTSFIKLIKLLQILMKLLPNHIMI